MVRTAGAVLALAIAANLLALYLGREGLADLAKPVAMASLLTAFVAAVRRWSPCLVLTGMGIVLSWVGDTLPAASPDSAQLTTALAFVAALVAYSAALLPLWLRGRDGLRLLLAVPYAGVVVGLFLACAEGAGHLWPAMLVYAIALAATAFLAAGVNGLTWIGGTLFLVSSSVLGIAWFLPGAWVPHAELWVMASYYAAQILLVMGIVRARAAAPAEVDTPGFGGATLLIVEG